MSFSAIKGQDKQIAMLKVYIEQSRLAGGYLFCGPQGIGKKMTAVALAKTLNCQEGALDACGKCPSCLKIEKKQHPDVHLLEFDGDEIKIEYIRQLQRDASLRPYEGKKMVFIIDNAHNLTPDASNALLKILEEPPKSCLIILISDKPGLLFRTIVSRCKVMKFSPLARSALKETFQFEYGLDSNRAHYLAYFSEGRLGRALCLKDEDALNDKNKIIDKLALSPAGRGSELPISEKEDMRRALNVLAAWFRDAYLIKAGLPETEMINFDRRQELVVYAGKFTFTELDRIMQALSDSALYLERNLNIKLLVHNLRAQIWKA